jgi:chromatin segregation and condensation protein Rec8/ScpA/Scc1 (kleisin family)
MSDSNAFLLGNVFRENKNKLTVSHFNKVMEMQTIQQLLNRMGKRFNLHKLVATLQVQFNKARQSEMVVYEEI